MAHNFNLRGLLAEETPRCPAVTAGATFKYGPNFQTIERRLGGGARALGMERANGTDFTPTTTRMLPRAAFGRPLILNGGIQFSQAAQLGYLGFADAWRMTGEGIIICLVAD